VITGDPAAFAIVREGVSAQGVNAQNLVDLFLTERTGRGIADRQSLSGPGRSGIAVGSTTTDEQVELLVGVIEAERSRQAGLEAPEDGQSTLTVLSSVLKGGGLGRGMPGYGPFKTQVAHVARGSNSNADAARSDAAIFFHGGDPAFILSVCVTDIPERRGELPGIALAEDFLRDVSRACWAAAVGKF
jgi:hypothetical protein